MTGVGLMFFLFLEWSHPFWGEDHRGNVSFSSHDDKGTLCHISMTTVDVDLDRLAEVVLVGPSCLEIIFLCPLSMLCSSEGRKARCATHA